MRSFIAEARAEKLVLQRTTTLIAHDPAQRSVPKADTAVKIAEAFAVPMDALYSPPAECLSEAVANFARAPIADVVKVPTVTLGDIRRAAGDAVVEIHRGRRKGRTER